MEESDTPNPKDRCAWCEEELNGFQHAGQEQYKGCISRAYWSRTPPAPRDQWYPTPSKNGWYLYGWILPDGNWRIFPPFKGTS